MRRPWSRSSQKGSVNAASQKPRQNVLQWNCSTFCQVSFVGQSGRATMRKFISSSRKLLGSFNAGTGSVGTRNGLGDVSFEIKLFWIILMGRELGRALQKLMTFVCYSILLFVLVPSFPFHLSGNPPRTLISLFCTHLSSPYFAGNKSC
ncbi:hypothetical protein DM860_010808 [Cuscuta australis]|uniref:Uncharacterized protein n=1 Tax=Cuscuta australis TaxID=267555 RepID=A0A328E1K5_9ASTE|nr:hypothetical protein DM860_010808 [Cuscuta australis]